MDLVLLMLVLAAVFAGRLRSTPAVLLGAGVLVTLAADLMDTTWAWNSLNAAWLMGYVCVGTAAVSASRATRGQVPPREDLTRRAERVRIFLLGTSVCVVPASLIFADATGTTNHPIFMNCVSIVLLGLVFRRLATLLRRLRAVVSEQHELSGRLQWEAEHDQLTGVANSAAFHLATDAALADSSRHPVSVAFVDLDGFKAINDGAGHRTGDELLRGVADRLRSVIRSSDVIARLGGDEFAILLPNMPADEVVGVGHRIVAAFGRPFETSHGAIHSHASIGFAEAKPGETSIDVLSNADSAMYEAKRQGKNRYALFDTAARQKAHDRLTMQATLEEALQHDRIEVHYQPIVNAQDGGWYALEALVRCRDDRGELFAPGAFLAVAEDSGLMPTIDRIVLETALQDMAHWRQIPGHQDLKVGVNVSGRWLLAPDFESTVSATLITQGLPPGALMIELTEDVHIADPVRCGAVLHRLRRAGVKIALDDFGTGYSSLAYLGQLPLDVIKMPLELTSSVTHDERSQALVGAVLSMATALGLQTVGEGVETVEQHETIRAMGCDLVQGYLFAKPQPADIISLELSAGPASISAAHAPRGH
jgi:diguanylate cyclase (GGDEF)-like protein